TSSGARVAGVSASISVSSLQACGERLPAAAPFYVMVRAALWQPPKRMDHQVEPGSARVFAGYTASRWRAW
ncbi:MAG TPA: hypothetical protein VFU88_07540, partial [Ktedonobacterales bacterium]|nr:hypothetical protein [Ktedonobacterales bacterium]